VVTERMQSHIDHIQTLKDVGLTTAHVVETFALWRLTPLKRRDLACTYSRLNDLNRELNTGK
jgi:hypothetical protein